MTKYDIGKHIMSFLQNYEGEEGQFGRKNKIAYDLVNYLESLEVLTIKDKDVWEVANESQ